MDAGRIGINAVTDHLHGRIAMREPLGKIGPQPDDGLDLATIEQRLGGRDMAHGREMEPGRARERRAEVGRCSIVDELNEAPRIRFGSSDTP